MELPKKISEEVVYNNKYRKVIKKKFQIKNWNIHDFMITWQSWTKIWTMVMPITKDWTIIYEKEYRYWTEEIIYNFPIWVLEEHLEEVENVKKELQEETWYNSNEIEYLWKTIAWNYDDWTIKYYIARNCEAWTQDLEDSEYIEVIEESIEEFEKSVKSWKINCPLTLSCWALWKDRI